MKLYHLTCDGQHEFVEAETIVDAIEKWRAFLIADQKGVGVTPGEPHSVVCVSDKAVIR